GRRSDPPGGCQRPGRSQQWLLRRAAERLRRFPQPGGTVCPPRPSFLSEPLVVSHHRVTPSITGPTVRLHVDTGYTVATAWPGPGKLPSGKPGGTCRRIGRPRLALAAN